MGEFNSEENYIYYCGQESLRRNKIAIIVEKKTTTTTTKKKKTEKQNKKTVQNAILGCGFKNDSMISVRFQGKLFNITVIQVYAPTSNAEEAVVEWFYEDLQDLLTSTQKRCPFHYRGLECKVGSQEIPGVTGKFGLGMKQGKGL